MVKIWKNLKHLYVNKRFCGSMPSNFKNSLIFIFSLSLQVLSKNIKKGWEWEGNLYEIFQIFFDYSKRKIYYLPSWIFYSAKVLKNNLNGLPTFFPFHILVPPAISLKNMIPNILISNRQFFVLFCGSLICHSYQLG